MTTSGAKIARSRRSMSVIDFRLSFDEVAEDHPAVEPERVGRRQDRRRSPPPPRPRY